ncbi:hypothetical protein [Isoptericola variabilis]|uniref:Uncharacterized protein n=1 Tax=Isoptericola variabilis (strain 225) TaxID=743718 RepID=F6FU40_ISOV2|nr:hypothetical protein [Isoptericola variabilis]AEG43236.1 hypothetical protein Isova_0439 [Isoptericola variabilis 225]TWH35171.1 hypothetical protein L600_000100001750 [Isoptericola variabilis J7]
MRPLGRLLAAAGTAALLVTGCAAEPGPDGPVPELAAVYSSIEDALSAERYDEARRDLRRLVAATESARAAGDLDEARADRVLAAAARLLATLPDPDPRATPDGDAPVAP